MSRFFVTLALCAAAYGQNYDIVLKGGHVMDPANGLDAIRDVAIAGGRIARVAVDIPAAQAKRAIDVTGRYVTPGLIDLHFHSYGYSGSIWPDDTALLTGTTTVVDAGGPGYRTFADFKAKVASQVATRVLALINIAGQGMTGESSEDNVADMSPEKFSASFRVTW